jgi:DEAD/DEAH box helicase domain-containing protein
MTPEDDDTTAQPRTDGGADSGGDRRGVLARAALEETFPGYEGQVVERRRLDARPAETVPPGAVLAPTLADALEDDLFSHQAAALEHLAAGENVAVTTSTSSGKTRVYALQIARNHLADPESTALCLYPTKALTRDQEATLDGTLRDEWGLDPAVGVYDGDTDAERKRRVRGSANVVLTNPAGLNVYLPRHARDGGWHRFYANLELVVVDEAHQYSGVTGTHVAWILRRLRRILRFYDSDPQFVLTSATIGNPAEHAARLTGAEFRVVDEDGSPRGTRDVVLWKPPVDWDRVEGEESGDPTADPSADPAAAFERARRSAGSEAARVTAHLAVDDAQVLQFCSARQGTEIAARQTTDAADSRYRSGAVSVEPYHAGLGKRSRRRVESRLKSGALDAVASTSALELGIDVGSVDATVTAGYPGTKRSFWQQVGRAGRGTADALSVLVGSDDALDAYVLDNPGYLFDDAVEDAVVSIDNERVYADHLLAAADERPLTTDDAPYLGGEERLREVASMWQEAGVLADTGRLDGSGVRYTGAPRPQGRLSLYGTGGREFEVVCADGEIDHDPVARERAYRDYHEGALLLHAGRQYRVVGVDDEGAHPRIRVERTRTDRYTQTLSTKRITDLRPTEHRSLAGAYDLYFGRGTVEITYDRYLVRQISTGDVVRGPLETGSPPMRLDTELMWVALPEDHLARTLDRLEEPLLQPTARAGRDALVPEAEDRYTYAGGLHAAEHGVIRLAPLELLIDNRDVGGLSTPRHAHETVPGPVWFVHDGIDGGVGFSRAIYEQFDALAARTREHLADCDCGRRRGCPLCVMSEDCGNDNDPLDRVTGRLILDDVLDALPGARDR